MSGYAASSIHFQHLLRVLALWQLRRTGWQRLIGEAREVQLPHALSPFGKIKGQQYETSLSFL